MLIIQLGVLPMVKLQLKHTNSGIKRGTFALWARLRFHAARVKHLIFGVFYLLFIVFRLIFAIFNLNSI